MSKLWADAPVIELNDNQKNYISAFGQEKYDKLWKKRTGNDERLQKKYNESKVDWWPWDTTEIKKAAKTWSESEVTMSSEEFTTLMDRLQKLEKNVEDSKPKKFEKGDWEYKWPRDYSYKIWMGKPVLWYEPKLKDLSYWPNYKNQHGNLVNNMGFVIAIYDIKTWETETVEADSLQFTNHFERSEKIRATVKRDQSWENVLGYTFIVSEKEFTVLPEAIN